MSRTIHPKTLNRWIRQMTNNESRPVQKTADGEVVVAVTQDFGNGGLSVQRIDGLAIFPDTTWRRGGDPLTRRRGEYTETLHRLPEQLVIYALTHIDLQRGQVTDTRKSFVVVVPPDVDIADRGEAPEGLDEQHMQWLREIQGRGLSLDEARGVLAAATWKWAFEAISLASWLTVKADQGQAIDELKRLRARNPRHKVIRLREIGMTTTAQTNEELNAILNGAIKLLETRKTGAHG